MAKAEITVRKWVLDIPYIAYTEKNECTPEKHELHFKSSNLLWHWFKSFKPKGFAPRSIFRGTYYYQSVKGNNVYELVMSGLNEQYMHRQYWLNDEYLGSDEQGLTKLHTIITAKTQLTTSSYDLYVDGDFEKYKVGYYEDIYDIDSFVVYDGLDITIKTEYNNPEEITYEDWYKEEQSFLPF